MVATAGVAQPPSSPTPSFHKKPRSNTCFFDFKCNGCGNIFRGFSLHCDKCNVNLDVKRAFLRPAMEEGEEAVVVGTHFSHPQHPLLLFHKIPADRIRCSVCNYYFSDPMSYGCLPCGFFLHPSCFKLPQETFHPFHPYHPLTLKSIKDEGPRRCNACRKEFFWEKFAYVCECKNCRFCLDIECTGVIMPAITYQGHDHLLQFTDNIRKINQYHKVHCSACHSICASYGFSCLYCDFNLHLTCGPLPSTIQHKSHIHPLILTSSPLEDEEDCEPDEFYCDACEEQRDPLLPIYYCKECRFVAELSCVISEVVSMLKGKHGDVELRNPFGQFGKLIREKQQLVINPALTLFDIFNSLSEAEKKELSNALRARGWKPITSKNSEYIEIFEDDDAYTQFMKFVDIGTEISTEFLDISEAFYIRHFKFRCKQPPKEEIVNIRDYKVTRKLAPILNDLLSKHGDVSAESKLSPKVKLYFFHMLCKCIYSMKNTKVVDITIKDLLKWWASLETSKFGGFRIQFAFDHLKRVALAHFGLSAEKQGSKALAQLDRDIEALKEKRMVITSIKSNLIKKCWRETSMLKGGKAGVGL